MSGSEAKAMARARITRLRVRYGETDRMGVIHHAEFVNYFEVGRTEYMREAGLPYAELERRGFLLVVTEVIARYHANVGYDAEIVIRTWVRGLGRASVTFGYAVEDTSGKLLCDGSTELACLDGQTRRPVRLPADVFSLLGEGRPGDAVPRGRRSSRGGVPEAGGLHPSR